ncbi:MAG TPA: LacI family DNA-binding transcriptional regulator [Candidatus Methylacidiphilales bacterium]|nr:LacI family DNA-binding transcriptional regulator [Candidatus Methylacidiphilales bacterium]
MPSLKDIAADVGVSHTLVSRVLNNRMGTTRVGAKTREAILRRAREMDYRPNPLAIALKRGRKGVVGVFIHQVGVPGSDLSVKFLESASAALAKARLNLWLQFFQKGDEFLAACNQRLTRSLDALIVAGLPHPELVETLVNLENQGLHVVCSSDGEMTGQSALINIRSDHNGQNFLTTKHLLDIGCRHIAHFDQIPDRLNGYLRAHKESSVPVESNLVLRAVNFSADSGYTCTQQLLDSGVKFDAINAQSDAQAAGAMRCLLERSIPMDKWPKITGVDDSPIARHYCQIPLTSTSSGRTRCAALAVDAVLKKLEGEPANSIVVTPTLIVRESTVKGAGHGVEPAEVA